MSLSSNAVEVNEPTCRTPIKVSPTMSGTPNIDWMPFSQRMGFATVEASIRSRIRGRRSAAIRPANPAPIGIRTPCRTSSSSPRAARAMSWSEVSSKRRIAAVSLCRRSKICSSRRVKRSSRSWEASTIESISFNFSFNRLARRLARTHRPSGAVRGSGPSCDPEGGVGNRSSGHGYLHTRRPDYQPPSLICSTGDQPRLAKYPAQERFRTEPCGRPNAGRLGADWPIMTKQYGAPGSVAPRA